jgi:uncharacterized protein (DUF58 family)
MRLRQKTNLAATLLRAANTLFPFSIRGLLLFLLAAGLLAEGLARADLASLFWGASFLLYTLYSILASHVTMLLLKRRRKTEPDFLTVMLPQSGMNPGDDGDAHVSARLPRALAPGFFVRFSFPLSWQDRSLDSITCRLNGGQTQRHIGFNAAKRGTYRSSEAFLEVSDLLGFTANRMSMPVAGTLTVHPAVTREQSWRILAEGEAPSLTTTRQRRSEELLEVRKYYPGDDARRLNWKVFAHSRELFLRVGEETPPPESRILFVIDTSENPLIPRQFRSDYLDALVESCVAAMDALLSDRTAVLLCRPGAKDCRQYAREKRTELLDALADQWWEGEPWQPSLPVLRRLHAAVFSTPGSPGLAKILAQIRDRGWSTSLFLKEPPGFGGAPPLRLADLLFLPAQMAKPDLSTTLLKARVALDDALARDLATYGGPSWRVRHAREV